MADLFKKISDGILQRNDNADIKDSNNESIGLDDYAPESEAADQSEGDDQDYHLEDCAHDIIAAVKANDPYMLADALREAFQKLDSEPHKEGPHEENE